MSSERFAPFHAAARDLPGRTGQPDSRRPVGYFCPMLPVEMIHAAGFAPVRIHPLRSGRQTGRISPARILLPSGAGAAWKQACPVLLDGLEGVVFGTHLRLHAEHGRHLASGGETAPPLRGGPAHQVRHAFRRGLPQGRPEPFSRRTGPLGRGKRSAMKPCFLPSDCTTGCEQP